MSLAERMDSGAIELIQSQCQTCKHRDMEKLTVCTAFPQGIPMAIFTGKFDHTKEYPGDNGVRYEPK